MLTKIVRIVVFALVIYSLYRYYSSPDASKFEDQSGTYQRLCQQWESPVLDENISDRGLIVVDARTGKALDEITVFLRWMDVPDRARAPEEVRYVGCVSKNRERVGVYQGGCDAYREDVTIKMVDLRTGKITTRRFDGSNPPGSIPAGECVPFNTGQAEDIEIKAWLNNVMTEGQNSSPRPVVFFTGQGIRLWLALLTGVILFSILLGYLLQFVFDNEK